MADFFTQALNTVLPTTDAVAGGVGPLSKLDLDPYKLNVLKYPQEVGTTDAPHYVRFDINLPNSSKYLDKPDPSGLQQINLRGDTQSQAQKNADLVNKQGGSMNFTGTDISNATQAGAFIGAGEGALTDGAEGLIQGGVQQGVGTFVASEVAKDTQITVKPKTTRTGTSIALYMPDTVTTAYDHNWNALSLTEAMGQMGKYAAYGSQLNITGIESGIWDDIKASWAQGHIVTASTTKAFQKAQIPTELKGEIAQKLGAVGGDFTTFALKNQGFAVNPHLEMVFQGTQNRHYVFVFDFQPRSAKEAQNIRQILTAFRAYAAPELPGAGNSSAGRYFIPPAEFDISYRFGNVENGYIAKISTCVLTNIAINWNQAGAFATFKDGAPIHINVQLTFAEIDTIYRELITEYGY